MAKKTGSCRVCGGPKSTRNPKYCGLVCQQRFHNDKKRDVIRDLKGDTCADCGGVFPPYILDFDHRDPSEKRFGIAGNARRKMEDLRAEVAKCDVVCANCHRERTHG